MRYLVLSDVHANVGALERVLTHARHQGWDALVSLGDTIGYGHAPNETLDLLRSLAPYVTLLGNHESVLLEALAGHTKEPAAPNCRSSTTCCVAT